MFRLHLTLTLIIVTLCIGPATFAGAGRISSKKELTVPRITAPRIDGDVTDIAWTTAALKGGKTVVDTQKDGVYRMRYPRVTYIGYDNEAIYVSTIVFAPDTTKLHDGGKFFWQGDDVEFHIQTNTDDRESYIVQVATTPKGYVGLINHDKVNRDKDRLKIAVTTDSIRWVSEIAIPFEMLGVKPPKVGDRWGFNITGVQQGAGGGHVSWNPTYGGFNEPDGFGVIIFGK